MLKISGTKKLYQILNYTLSFIVFQRILWMNMNYYIWMRLDLTFQKQEEEVEMLLDTGHPPVCQGSEGVLGLGPPPPCNSGTLQCKSLAWICWYKTVTEFNQKEQVWYIVVWNNGSFHWAAVVQNWFHEHPEFEVLHLHPCSPFQASRVFFGDVGSWPGVSRVSLSHTEAGSVQEWIRLTRGFLQQCLVSEDSLWCGWNLMAGSRQMERWLVTSYSTFYLES